MLVSLKSVVNYDVLSLIESFLGSCFGHAFFKAYQYVLINEKVCKGLKYLFIKTTQFDLHKCITLGGTLNVKFGVYVCQMTIFWGPINNCPTHFLSPYYHIYFNVYIY